VTKFEQDCHFSTYHIGFSCCITQDKPHVADRRVEARAMDEHGKIHQNVKMSTNALINPSLPLLVV